MLFSLLVASSSQFDIWKVVSQSHWVSKSIFFILVFCSVLSVAVIVERWIVLRRVYSSMRDNSSQLDELINSREFTAAYQNISQGSRKISPLLAILHAGIAQWQQLSAAGENRLDFLEVKINEAIDREIRLVRAVLRNNLPILANIASTAPFIGLLGTVIGIVFTFDAIAKTGNMGQDLVASGIADALIATAMGLFAAIPAVLAYNAFAARINQMILEIENLAADRIYYLIERDATVTIPGHQ